MVALPQRLTDEEFRRLVELLHRFCEVDLDQFANWSVKTTFGRVYVSLSRHPAGPEDAYDSLDPWLG